MWLKFTYQDIQLCIYMGTLVVELVLYLLKTVGSSKKEWGNVGQGEERGAGSVGDKLK